MGWEVKVGDLPILKTYIYNVTGNDVIQAQPSFSVAYPAAELSEINGINLAAQIGHEGDIDLIHIPVTPNDGGTPTSIIYYAKTRGTRAKDLYLRDNSTLGFSGGNTGIFAYRTSQPLWVFGVKFVDNEGKLTGVGIYGADPRSDAGYNAVPAYSAPFCVINVNALRNRGYDVDATESSEQYGPASQPSGYDNPAFDHTSDTIGIPDKPTVSVTTAGFYHAYKVTTGLLNDFGAKLFPSVGQIVGSITGINTVEDVLKQAMALLLSPSLYQDTQIAGQTISIIDMIMNGKAIDYVVDCHIIPVSPEVGGSANIKCGAQTLDITAPVVTDDYIDFECGSISIPENFQNYLDYHGTRAKLYLTGVGFVDIKPEFWNGGTLSVKYRFNILDGSFMCYVSSTSGKSQLANTVIGQYGGCMCLHIPVTGINYASMISGLVTGSMSLAGNLASGNAVGVAGSALSVANVKPSLAQSNNYNSSTAFLGVRRPYLQIERQVPSFSTRYNVENGLPLNVSMSLGSVSGFTVVEDPQLNLTCDDDEREEIYILLQKGVIF